MPKEMLGKLNFLNHPTILSTFILRAPSTQMIDMHQDRDIIASWK